MKAIIIGTTGKGKATLCNMIKQNYPDVATISLGSLRNPQGGKMYQVRYSINITEKDIIRAKRAYKQGAYAMGYIDPIRFEIVEHYLSHFSTKPVNTKDILEQSLMDSIVKQDSYLGMLNNPQVLIPESFDEVCDFIGSIPSGFS